MSRSANKLAGKRQARRLFHKSVRANVRQVLGGGRPKVVHRDSWTGRSEPPVQP